MRRESLFVSLAIAGGITLLSATVPARSYAQNYSGAHVDTGIFYEDLDPYGDWVELPDYGWSFAPRVDRNWRPYTRGQWIWTDDGWYWDSDEDFGWAAYHYGRWVNHRYYGWVWIPGTEWAPAWVSWRHGNGYPGLAPLPARATWRTRIGLSIGGLEIDAYIGASDYAFVSDRSFVDRGVYQRVVPPAQNITIINVTNNITNYAFVNDRVVNRGVAVANIEHAVGRRVPLARTVDMDRANSPRRSVAGEVAVFRPQVKPAPERRPAQGRSLVRGDAPPPFLVERRQERDRERQQRGNPPEVTARDVEQRRAPEQGKTTRPETQQPRTTAPRSDPKARQPEAPQQPDQARQGADRQKALAEEQQRAEREKQRARDQQQRDQRQRNSAQDQQGAQRDRDNRVREEQKARDTQSQSRPAPTRPDAKPQSPPDPRPQQQEAQRQRDQARQEADQQRATAQEKQRAEREKAKRDPRTQPEKPPNDAPQDRKGNPKDNKKSPKPTPNPAPDKSRGL